MENVNELFAEFAGCFVGTVRSDVEIVFPEKLNRRKLDYSLQSLKVVDRYLDYLHRHHSDQWGPQWVKTALWGGAYVGEVIRRQSQRQYDWIDFDEFAREYPETLKLLGSEKQLGFVSVLTPGEGSFTMPINKLLRFIHEGPGDSVHYYAVCELRNG